MVERKTAKVAPAHSTSSQAMLDAAENVIGVRIHTEMLVVEDGVIPFDSENGVSLGEMLDRQLESIAKHGGMPQKMSYEFDTAAWEQAKPFYAAKYDERNSRNRWDA